jgi:hypothetical protein
MHDLKVWVLTGESFERPPSASKLSRALGRIDGRHRPMMVGKWGGEVVIIEPTCAELEAIGKRNGPKLGTRFIFNALLYCAPSGSLDEERLKKWLPRCQIHRFHGNLELGWEFYLTHWSQIQIGHRTVAQVAAWVNKGQRGRVDDCPRAGAIAGTSVSQPSSGNPGGFECNRLLTTVTCRSGLGMWII